MSEQTVDMTPKTGRQTAKKLPEGPDFEEVVNLMAVGSEAAARLAEIKAETDLAYVELVDEFKSDYAKFQAALASAEAAMEVFCRKNPKWFSSAKSVKTPYGKIAFRSGTSLVVRDEEATVRLIQALHAPEAGQFLRIQAVPDLEALEKLDDEELKRILVKRESADVFRFTPAGVELGKAAKEAAEKN